MSELGVFGQQNSSPSTPSSSPVLSGGSPIGGQSELGVFGGGSPAPAVPSAGAATASPTAKSSGGHHGGGLLGRVGHLVGDVVNPVAGAVDAVGGLASKGLNAVGLGGAGKVVGEVTKGAANFVNPYEVVTHTLPNLGIAAGTDVKNLGEAAVGRGPLGAIIAEHAPGSVLTPPKVAPQGPILNQLQKALPLTGGLVAQTQKTGAHLAGAAQAAAGLGQGGQGLLGRGFQHETARDYAADPFGAALGDVGTVAVLAGPAARALGAAGSAVGAGAEEGSLAGRLGSGLTAAGEGVGQVGEAANRVMTAPFAPFKAGAEALGGVARGVTGAEGPIASTAGRLGASLGEGLADRRLLGAGRTVGEWAQQRADVGLARRGILTPAIDAVAQRRGVNLAYQRDAAAAAGGDPEVVQAAINREAGREQGAQVAVAAQEHGIGLPGDMPTERVARLTAGLGTSAEQAAVEATAQVLRSQAEARTAEELAGVGRLSGPLPPEQAGSSPLSAAVAKQVAPFEQRLAAVQRQQTELAPRVEAARAQRIYTPDELAHLKTSGGAAWDQANAIARRALVEDGREQAARAAGITTKHLPGDEAIVQQLTGAILEHLGGARQGTQTALPLYAQAVTAPVGVVPRGTARLAGVAQRAGQTEGEVAARTDMAGRLAQRAEALRQGAAEPEPPRQLLLGEQVLPAPPSPSAPPGRPVPAEVTAPFEDAAVRARSAAQAAAKAVEAAREAENKIAGDAQMAHAVSEVRSARAAYTKAIADERAQLDNQVRSYFQAGGIAAPLLSKGAGAEYDAIRSLSPSDRAALYRASAEGGAGRLPPDVWLQQVEHLFPAGTTVDEAVAKVVDAIRARSELGRLLQPGGQGGIGAYIARQVSPDEAGYVEAVLHGTPLEAAQRLAAEFQSGGTQGIDRLAEAFERVDRWLAARSSPAPGQLDLEKLTPVEQQIANRELARYEATRASEGLAAARADLISRLTAIGRKEGEETGRLAGVQGARRSFATELDRVANGERLAAGRLAGPDVAAAQRQAVVGAGASTAAGIRIGQVEERARVLERQQDMLNRVEARRVGALWNERQNAEANPQNAPARFRPALLGNRAQVAAINAAADAADKITPGAGDEVRSLTEGLPTVLAEMREQGIDPTHFTGPAPTPRGAGLGKPGVERLPRMGKLPSERTKVAGVLPASLADIRTTEDLRARQVVANETGRLLLRKMGQSAAERGIPVQEIPSSLVPVNLTSPFEVVPRSQVTDRTPLLPKAVYDSFRNQLGPPATKGAALSMWDSVIRAGKDLSVGLSPAYWVAVIAADSLKALALSDANPLSVAANMPRAFELIRDHPEDPLVATLTRSGLSAEQGELAASHLEGPRGAQVEVSGPAKGGLLHRLAAPAWNATSRLQDVQRVAVGLAKRDVGASIEEQVAEARRVMGRFDNLTAAEQNVRRAIPSYAFVKHVATLTLRLPVDNPARMAMLGYLYQAAGKPNSPWAQLLNPAGVLGGPPSLTPALRFAGNLIGEHVAAKWPPITAQTSPAGPNNPFVLAHGARALPEVGYLAAQRVPVAKAALAALEPNVHRYQTGEPTKTAAPYPGGRLGGVAYALGLQPAAASLSKRPNSSGGTLSGASPTGRTLSRGRAR